ncbi:uncharacterized protein Triagg1_494 [Trichoderma aggressivum f. europaeum]|uniref:Uncharacterized protein n=1 Tax=Trichoderma aggressivum f. europaeum TaxID=173218 RepID=A0AAE1JFT0_9HYPO|nr:hypothetical protein Triagg1_494 [Trichoderma aggressivum f. europaeum]
MSRQRLAMTTIAGVGMISVIYYATRKNESAANNAQLRRNQAQDIRELGLGSAGVGGNRMTGGPSNSAAPSGSERDPQRDQVQLPTGGVGGGEASSKSDHFRLHSSILGGGGKATASRQDHEGYHDTRGISKMGSEIPSKRGPADASN